MSKEFALLGQIKGLTKDINNKPIDVSLSADMVSNEGHVTNVNPDGFDLKNEELKASYPTNTELDPEYRNAETGEVNPGSGWPDGDLFKYMYRATDTLVFDAVTHSKVGYLALYANNITFLNNPTLTVSPSTAYFSGYRGNGGYGGNPGTSGSPGTVGVDRVSGFWDWTPTAGNGGNGGTGRTYNSGAPGPGGLGATASGFASGGGGGGSGGDGPNASSVGGGAGGNGGSLILLIADTITGACTLNAKGLNGGGGTFSNSYTGFIGGGGGGGGGGTVLIITGSYSGELTINVAGGASGTPSGGTVAPQSGQLGSYAILRRNTDDSLTLMVHSQNGVSADLNGQTPVHGADASIAW